MNNFFGIDKETLEEKKSFNTAKEILQQPKLWKETLEIFRNSEKSLKEYFKKIGFGKEFDVVFTGAGTSEYVGNILEPLLNKNETIVNPKTGVATYLFILILIIIISVVLFKRKKNYIR